MEKALDEQVRVRAGHACEYCMLPQNVAQFRFPIDHVIARQHAGQTVSENLALACGMCNSFKGPNIAGIDPDTGRICRLFHPRRDTWHEHFRWNGTLLLGISDVGRTTVAVLAINLAGRMLIREALDADRD